MNNLQSDFTNTFRTNRWANAESKSGEGSSLAFAGSFLENLSIIIDEKNITSIFDCSCGDWNWMRHIKDKFKNYTGNDIVADIIKSNTEKYGRDGLRFTHGDMIENLFVHDPVDLIICRHTFEHLPNEYIFKALTLFKEKAKYAIITSMNYKHITFTDLIPDGYTARGINLDIREYSNYIGIPLFKFWDHYKCTPIPTEGTFGYFYKF